MERNLNEQAYEERSQGQETEFTELGNPSLGVRKQKPIPPPLNLNGCSLVPSEIFGSCSWAPVGESGLPSTSPNVLEKHLPIRKRRSSYSLTSPCFLPSPSSLTNFVQKNIKSPFLSPFSPSYTKLNCSELITPPPNSGIRSPGFCTFSSVTIPVTSYSSDLFSSLSPPPSCTQKVKFEEFDSSVDEQSVELGGHFEHVDLPPQQDWAGPVWLCFEAGTRVRFLPPDIINLDRPHHQGFTYAEELADKERSQGVTTTIAPYGVKVLNIDLVSGQSTGLVFLYLSPFLLPTVNILAECSYEHPFYVGNKGWSSVYPDLTFQRYGMACSLLEVDDVCVGPASLLQAIVSPSIVCDKKSELSVNHEDHWQTASAEEKKEFVFPVTSQCANDTQSPVLKVERVFEFEIETPPHSVLFSSSYSSNPSTPVVSNLPSTTSFEDSPRLPNSPPPAPARRKKTKKHKDEGDKTRRPMNGFMIFAQRHRLELIQKNPGKDNRSVSIMLGETWKSLSQSERNAYSEEARKLAEEHKRMYPDCWKRKRYGSTNAAGTSV